MDFNPRAPCGARRLTSCPANAALEFQSTRPLRGATYPTALRRRRDSFQSTRPLRGATISPSRPIRGQRISIHAPLAGRDARGARAAPAPPPISIHAPLAGRDADAALLRHAGDGISIHAPLAGRDYNIIFSLYVLTLFQSTRPLRGATRTPQCRSAGDSYFNPRAPCGARRGSIATATQVISISIHAPLAGRDCSW